MAAKNQQRCAAYLPTSGCTEREWKTKKTAPTPDAASAVRPTRSSVAASIPITSHDELRNAIHPFTAPKKRGRKRKDAPDAADDESPYPDHATVRILARHTPSPETNPADDDDNPPHDNSPDDDVDAAATGVHCNDYGARRLLPGDLMTLRDGTEVCVVIPVDRKEESDEVKKSRAKVKVRIKRQLLDTNRSIFGGLKGEAKEKAFDSWVKDNYLVRREGWYYCQFSGVVTNFAERDQYTSYSNSLVDQLIGDGAGIAIKFDCESELPQKCMRGFELRLDELPVVEMWKRRTEGEFTNQSISFPMIECIIE